VSFQFTKQGVITIKAESIPEDQLMELALDAGAEDVRNEGEVYEVITAPVAFHKVKESLAARKVQIEASEITHLPNNTVAVDGETAQRILKLIDALEDNDDVQSVAHNAELPESVTV
jgi:transcriptional/translational regulatory protein YebC/TACO1